jgi:hypothetical protein
LVLEELIPIVRSAMPRIRRGLEQPLRPAYAGLVKALEDELRNEREGGQPTIDELHFPETNAIRVTVIWDRWEGMPDEDRQAVILQAYENVEGKEFRDRIALAIGLTVPEAEESGLLPYAVVPVVRRGDPVTLEQCFEAMMEQGGSVLSDPKKPALRFASQGEADRCVQRLIKQLPASEPVWSVVQEVGSLPAYPA